MPETVAFLGIGNLGLPMASNLLKAGHPVIAFDPQPERVASLAALGARAARSGAEAAHEAGIVLTMVPSGKELRQVFFDDGVLAAARPDSLFIDCSTVDPESARSVKKAVQAAGHQMVDAPVSGGSVRAEQAALTIMVGGTAEAFAQARPLLAAMASTVRHMGPDGTGLLAKICNNMIAGVTQVAVSEAFVLAGQLGLDTTQFYEVVAHSSGQCWAVTTNCPIPGPVPSSPANFQYRPGGAATMLQKDLSLAQAAAIEAGVPIPMASQALSLYTLFCNSGLGHLDVSAIIKLYARPDVASAACARPLSRRAMAVATPPVLDDGFRWHPNAGQKACSRLAALLHRVGLESFQDLVRWSREQPDQFWESILDFSGIRFYRPYEQLCDLSRGVAWPRWCVGGTTNLVLNTLDRQIAAGRGVHPALLWVAEDGQTVSWDYDRLQAETCRIAASLARLGCKAGDSVALFLPILPETVAVFYAVAKIGAIALPLFSGFGADAVATRVNAGGSRVIVTADGARRRGKTLPMKATIDAARPAMPQLEHVIVLDAIDSGWERRSGDLDWAEFVDGAPTDFPTAQLDAEAPLMVLYTSGTTGKPKGALHTHVGFLAKMSLDYNILNETGPDDRFIWMSDMGWLVGPAQIATTGMVGATLVLAEGVPDYPANDRLLRLASDHRVTVFGLSPTLARMMKAGVASDGSRIDMSSIRIVISGGEPWDLPTWEWTMDYMCRGVAPIMNHCGGTEIGTLVVSSILDPMKPGGFSGPAPGTGADIVDVDGRSLPPGEIGELVMRQASMGTTKGLYKDNERYLESYWSRIPGMWVQGDLASRDADGIWYVHGRSDDTLKIAGKRTGPTEIEAALLSSGELTEACAVGVPDPVKGYALVCVVVPRPDASLEGLPGRLRSVVMSRLGASYAPKEVITVDALPKNRTNKLVRRLVRNALSGQPLGDLSSIVNPEAVDVLRARSTS